VPVIIPQIIPRTVYRTRVAPPRPSSLRGHVVPLSQMQVVPVTRTSVREHRVPVVRNRVVPILSQGQQQTVLVSHPILIR
jgi:hypothetical protein